MKCENCTKYDDCRTGSGLTWPCGAYRPKTGGGMDIEKLIEQLRDKGCEDCPHRDTCRDDDTAECVIRLNAATALSTLKAENEKLRAELEKVKRERDAAVKDLNEFLSLDELCPIQCKWCKWENTNCDGKIPEWRGPQKKD